MVFRTMLSDKGPDFPSPAGNSHWFVA